MAEGRRPDTRMIARRVIELLEADLVTGGYDLLDVRVFQGGGRYQIRVFVDLLETSGKTSGKTSGNESETGEETNQGISLDKVAKAARTAGMLLEEADLFADQYVIEVSSPGIRRPLRKAEHYQQVVGEKVDLKVMGAGSYRVRGVLEGVEVGAEETELIIETPALDSSGDEDSEAVSVRVQLHRVLEGNLDPDFDAKAIINSDRRERKESKREARREKASKKKKGRPKNRLKDRTKNDGGSTS